MGRTKRRRLKLKLNRLQVGSRVNLEEDQNLIDLQKWLKQNHWHNSTNLKIRHFAETGRGVTSKKVMHQNDTLITVPYDLMITFTTIQTYFSESKITLDEQLTMQEFLALFLMLERNNELSSWKEYIKSLPSELPDLPWLKPTEEINLYPPDLQIASKKNVEKFETSLERVRKSIGKHLHCVSLEILFKWAYVLVNTRVVYVDPYFVWAINNSLKDLLMDQPSQALCPFLDMFNHHFQANTEASLIQENDRLIYELKTFVSYKAYDQIMISYGPHDNDTLLLQYGFFIPGNIYDVVKYDFQTVQDLIKFNLDKSKYRFIKDHNFDNDLYIGQSISFNLKALFYVIQNVDIKNCSVNIFSDSYPENFTAVVDKYCCILLENKLQLFQEEFEIFKNASNVKCESKLMESYLRYKISFVILLINKYK